MIPFIHRIVLSLLFLAAGCAAPPEPPPVPTYTTASLAAVRYKAVLVAGDYTAKAFDHGTEAMRERLLGDHAAPEDIQLLSTAFDTIAVTGVHSATLAHVVSAIEQLHPVDGEGCFVFATSHGARGQGLALTFSREFLSPAVLDRALLKGCGGAPTVVIISGCFSGIFTQPPMARGNRIIFTAARQDRPSFGCGADFYYTVYDECLLKAMDRATVWRAAYAMVQACVTAREQELGYPASGPQAWFGDAVHGMRIPKQRTMAERN